MSTKMLMEKFEALSPAAQSQVSAFVAALSSTQAKTALRKGKRFAFQWAGGLADLKSQFTAVELQHHISELR